METELVELKLAPVQSGDYCSPFKVKPSVKNDLKIGADSIDVESLKKTYPHLEPITLSKYHNADVEIILVYRTTIFQPSSKSIFLNVACRKNLKWNRATVIPSKKDRYKGYVVQINKKSIFIN